MANQYLVDMLNWRQAYSTSSLNENSEKFGKNIDNAEYIKNFKKRRKISVQLNVYICNVLLRNCIVIKIWWIKNRKFYTPKNDTPVLILNILGFFLCCKANGNKKKSFIWNIFFFPCLLGMKHFWKKEENLNVVFISVIYLYIR